MSTIKEDAQKYQLAQAQRLLEEFRAANGREAKTVDELEAWVGTRRHLGGLIDPYRGR